MFWYVIAAVVVSTVALLACLVLLPKWVAAAFDHSSDCGCNTCSRRRMRQWDRLNDQRGVSKEVLPLRNVTEMISTRELCQGDLVSAADASQQHSKRYIVRELVIRDYGWIVILVNTRTDAVAWVRIGNDRLDTLLWRRFQKHRKGHVTGL